MSILSGRWLLLMKAVIWRFLMRIGMRFHKFASPQPPPPSFTVKVPSRLSQCGGNFNIIFYVPDGYYDAPEGHLYPVVVNYHGGGFTIGTGTDDARWASAVLKTTNSVFASVEYRLAPKYPFSVGVEDGTDAVIYLAAHADELRLDPNRMALSGFSAGGNFALTIPLMLQDLMNDVGNRTLQSTEARAHAVLSSSINTSKSSISTMDRAKASTLSLAMKPLIPTSLEIDQEIPMFKIQALVSFYPPTDFRISRADKRKTNPRPELNMPPMFTDLFDESYLPEGKTSCELDLSDPYLSPAAATDFQLQSAYPDSIILYTCEYDMLSAEGVAFGERLKSDAIGKTVKGGLIRGALHGFDRKPNPLRFSEDADRCYSEACAELNEAFGKRQSVDSKHQLDDIKHVDRFEDHDKIDCALPGPSTLV